MESNAYKVHSQKDLEEVWEGTESRRRGMEVSEWLHLGCHGRSRRQELGHRLEGQWAMCVSEAGLGQHAASIHKLEGTSWPPPHGLVGLEVLRLSRN